MSFGSNAHLWLIALMYFCAIPFEEVCHFLFFGRLFGGVDDF